MKYNSGCTKKIIEGGGTMSDNRIKQKSDKETKKAESEKRREFLRKSMYAAYATPVIMALLVDKASAWDSQTGIWCPVHGWVNPKHPLHYPTSTEGGSWYPGAGRRPKQR